MGVDGSVCMWMPGLSKDFASHFLRHWTTASRWCHTRWSLCCLALSIIFCSPFAEIKDKPGFWQNSSKPETFTCVVWWLVCQKHREWAELKFLKFSEGFDSACFLYHPVIFNGASKDTARSWHCSYTVERCTKQQLVDQVIVNIEIKHQWQSWMMRDLEVYFKMLNTFYTVLFAWWK